MKTVVYPLHELGYLNRFLIVGPFETHYTDREMGIARKDKVVWRKTLLSLKGFGVTPPEEACLGGCFKTSIGSFPWRIYTPFENPFLEFYRFCGLCSYLEIWAYTIIESSMDQVLRWEIGTFNDIALWVNGEKIADFSSLTMRSLRRMEKTVSLRKGMNRVVVRLRDIGVLDTILLGFIRILDVKPDTLRIIIPCREDVDIEYLKVAEKMLGEIYIPLYFSMNPYIELKWNTPLKRKLCLKIDDRVVYVEANSRSLRIPIHDEGFHEFRVKIGSVERPIYVLFLKDFSERFSGNEVGFRREKVLRYVAKNSDVFGAMADLALGVKKNLEPRIEYSLNFVNRRRDCSDFQLAGIIRLWHLFKNELSRQLEEKIRKCILNFRYWRDEPGNDIMCFLTENHSILFHSSEYLAGQEFPDKVFSNSGMRGEEHRLKALHMIENWIREREENGFIEWYSSTYYPLDLLALLNIYDFCDLKYLKKMAEKMLDEIFRQTTLATFKGVWTAPQGRAYNESIMTGIVSPMSIITYLTWGIGAPIGDYMGAAALATSSYRPPRNVLKFLDVEKELYVREKHRDLSGENRVELTFYKTPDYMLSSVTSHPRGQTPGYFLPSTLNHPTGPGYQQHMWQATLAPGSIVFTNHPGEFLESEGYGPSFWAGNGLLPKIMQVKNLLLTVYSIPEDYLVPFTHAYFPSLAFDEVKIDGNWIFFRKGESYGALWSYIKPVLITSGPTAYKELRAYGRRNAWLCRLSSRREVGEFQRFIRLVKNEPKVIHTTIYYKDFEHGKISIKWPI